ncbi:hypothetical protein HDU79_006973 [Rhizoclosmatium sp. JEL0117]|nr:hypothetical protein HDU79_006973 [Rhizoclosmatium sp. JEL0117]
MSETIIYQSGTCAAGTAIMAVFASSSVAGTCVPSSCMGAGSVGTSLSCNGSASDVIAQIPGNALVASFYSDSSCSSSSNIQTFAVVLNKCISLSSTPQFTMSFKYTYDAATGFNAGVYSDSACTVPYKGDLTTASQTSIPQCAGQEMPKMGACATVPDSCQAYMKEQFKGVPAIGSFMYNVNGGSGSTGSGSSGSGSTGSGSTGSGSTGSGSTGSGSGAVVTTTKSSAATLTVLSSIVLAMLLA